MTTEPSEAAASLAIADCQVEMASRIDPIIGAYPVTAEELAAYLDGPYRFGPEERAISCALVAACAAELVDEADVRSHHRHVSAAVRLSRGRLLGAVTINPLHRLDESLAEFRRLVIDESFRAVKFDPTAHGYLPQRCDDVIGPILEEAAGLRVPALFEMGNPPFSTPVLTAVLAEAHPRTTIVLCNLGSDNVVYAQEAAYVAAMNRNVFLTTAGATMPRLRQVIAALGPDRVLFASGFPRHDAASQLRLVEALGEAGPVGPAQSSEALDLVLSGNFRRLFGADSALATPA